MKRKMKNLFMGIILTLLIATTGFTVYFANKSIVVSNNNTPSMSETETGNAAPPDIPDGNGTSDMEEPPEKPDGEENSETGNVPEKPDGEENSETGNVPEKPDGEENSETGNVPEKPDGEENSENGNAPTMPTESGNTDTAASESVSIIYYVLFGVESLCISLLIMYFILSGFNKKSFKETFISRDKVLILILSSIILTAGLTYAEKTIAENINIHNDTSDNMSSEMNGSPTISYASPNEITETTYITSGDYSSENASENAVLVSGDIDVTMENINITKTGDSDGGDNTSFYGTNSGIIAKDGVNLTLKNITVETNATGANGIFSYGGSATTNNANSDGTTINISDSKITTTKDNSGGIMTTGGGIMNATNLEITTSGISSAAIRTDRGGGTVTVNGGTYKTTGAGSPSVYSTADITVKNADLISTASEGIVIEGKNKVTLENVNLTDTNDKLNGQSTTYKNIFLYQSMSGDASEGVSEFSAKNSTVTTNKGDTLYVTNTDSKITLTNNKIINNDKTGNFLRVQKDSWGNNGSNGGNVTLYMSNQEASGNIVIDSISTLDMTMKEGSYYKGTINGENSAEKISLTLDKSSKIKLTGDSYITALNDADSDYSNIDFNGYKLYVNGKAINS